MVMNAAQELVANNITRIFENKSGQSIHALDQFSLNIHPGEIVSLIGPSGCGKSTFLRLVAGLDAPQGGNLTYGGQAIAGTSRERGFVFQSPNLFPWLTVYDNIAFGLRATKTYKENKAKITDLIHLMGLHGFEHVYPYQISGGMASRTALARVFIQNPGLILLDEPLSALDAFTRMSIQDEILNIWNRRKPTILLVTHDIEEAVYLSHRVLVLSPRPAKVTGEVPIDLEHPRDRTSAAFIEKRKQIMEQLTYERVSADWLNNKK